MNNNYPYNDYQNNYPNDFNNNSSNEQYQEEGVSIFFTLAIVLLLLLFAMYFFKFGIFKEKEEMVSAEAISLNMKEAKIAVGQSLAIEATITPKDSTDFVVWSSSDTTIATVDNNGKVLGLKPGSVKITAKINERILAECVVNVVDGNGAMGGKYNAVEVYPSSINIAESSKEISVGENYKIEVQLLPSNVTNDALTWSSSNPSVATVYNGEVVGISPGTVVITVKTINDLVEAVTITVKGVPVQELKIDKTNESITINGSVTLVAETVPADATDPGITWSSSDDSIATVDKNGKVTGKKEGTVTITATSSNNKTASCKVSVVNKEVPITAISLKKTSLALAVNESQTLKVSITPSNATNKSISWSSSDRSVATVNSSGKVTGKKVGTATITATTSNGMTATCSVTVSQTAVTGISLDKSSLTLSVGSTGTFTATVTPVNASDKSITWSSSDRSVATVDSSGKVKAIKAGTSKITATASNGMKAEATVTVQAGGSGGGSAPTITLNKSTENICVGCKVTLVATTNPANLTVTWTSMDPSVATVTSTGIVTGKKVGSTTIVASAGGKEARFVAVVKADAAESVTLDKTSATIEVNKTVRLTPTIYPTTVTNKAVTWSSSNTNVATVVNGVVTGIRAGTATITVRTSNGKTATCSITVVNPGVTEIRLNKSSMTLAVGSTGTLTATVLPTNATTTITWTSDDSSVATVNSSGVVTAKSSGTTRIRATASNGVYAICNVTVSGVALTGIDVYPSSISIRVNETYTLSASPRPSNASLGTVTWTSTNTSVATVNSSGKVTGKSTGTTTIKATYGGKTGSATVSVYSGSVSLTISPSLVYGGIYDTAYFNATVSNSTNYNIVWYSSGPCSLSYSGKSASAYATSVGDCIIYARDTISGREAHATFSIGYG